MPEATSIDRRGGGPLYVLHHALVALGRATATAKPADVVNVEAFWCFDGSDYCSGGFVLWLSDRRRVYLDAWIELANEDEASSPTKVDIEIAELPADQQYPQFPSASDPIGGWRDDVELLNDFLRGRTV